MSEYRIYNDMDTGNKRLGRASLFRPRLTPPRVRVRSSILAFALRAKLSPRIVANNSSSFGPTST